MSAAGIDSPMTQFSHSRRQFLSATGAAMAALAASGCRIRGGDAPLPPAGVGYGGLKPDPAGFFDLPEGFSYRVISRLDEPMSDGQPVPDRADGMGCFDLGEGRLALVRNHEMWPDNAPEINVERGYRRGKDGNYLPGGTTTLVVDAKTLQVEREFRSLAGTMRNCAGGVTPWGTWLSCEEAARYEKPLVDNHGWVFEVPAAATGLVDAIPLKAMGRFQHEAACVDPATGYVYLTEDRSDGLFYRFIPAVPGELAKGGKLQALAIEGLPDTRNWDAAGISLAQAHTVSWIDLANVEAPDDDLRLRGAAQSATLFARGEGIHMGEGELYFTCTNGGAKKLGQIFRLQPGRGEHGDLLELFFESASQDEYDLGDNLTIAPDGQLIVCEDEYGAFVTNYLRGVTRGGEVYPFALLHAQTELAGACFSPDGRVLFVNAYSPTATLAITGPWQHLA